MLPSPSAQLASANLFIVLSILTGLVGAFINPLMTYFLVDGLAVPPIYIGLYTISLTLSGLIISQWLGNLADKGSSSRKLYILATVGTIAALVIYSNTQSFLWVLAAGVTLMALGNATTPQMLTLGRQWAGNNKVNILQFNARIRACFSFAWMLGPPLGFMLVASIGFAGAFSVAIFFAVLGMLFVMFFVPEQQIEHNHQHATTQHKAPLSFWLLGASVVMGSMANTMYTSALPLYTLNELALPSYTPGLLMGLVACIEIPVMLFTNRLSRWFDKTHLLAVSFVFGLVFYIGIFNAYLLWHFVLLQLFNAIFYGLYAGIGLTLMQEQLPNRIGFTSAFYSNGMKVGLMFGSTAAGVIAQFGSFQYATLGSAVATVLAIIILILFNRLKHKQG
ncbi:sugar efflux transporter [Paraglaciecola aquimarina]|uniref:Sugar efflux transporter n=1 Tax=Paraglaciecola aquimarina TaxID=1235557 RepID=A0ABU3T1A9_9ALTE|nr:sugar efflux transporter [Paraglaciecola aquimarina]MDU0356036.1 sugar efflux transporter [Paraglaciecola aquimarina]